MSQTNKLSLPAAVFVNINIMLGTGTFVNTVILAQKVGVLGGLLYLAAGAVMLPLIFCIAKLTKMHPGGGFYTFGSTINTFWGFISSWSYFVGKLASASLGIHVFTMFLQSIIPALALYNTLALDAAIIALFVGLNLLHVKTGSKIQYLFLFTKLTPVAFTILFGLHHAQLINIQAPHLIWSGLPIALPLVLFCCLGFEATCSLAAHIENSKRNAPRAILISFATVIILSVLYQTVFYATLGQALSQQQNYTHAFPLFVNHVAPYLAAFLVPFFSIAIGLSAVGGAYGIMYSNTWNLFALAKNKHLIGSSYFAKLNQHHIPYLCVLAEGAICLMHLLFSQGSQVPLQYTSTLACLTTYTISVLSLVKAEKTILSFAGIASCAVALSMCFRGFVFTSLDPLIRFLIILAIGTAMFVFTQSTQLQRHKSKKA